VQVDSIKIVLKAPMVPALELQYVKVLSNFAFKVNLRRYSAGLGAGPGAGRRDLCPPCYAVHAKRHTRLDGGSGRGLHSSTPQLNLSCFCHLKISI